jgi:ribosomal protein S15P/S13E
MPGTAGRSGGDRRLTGDSTHNDGLPELPTGLSASATEKWQTLLQQIPAEHLRKVDQHLLKQLAVLLAEADTLTDRLDADPMDDRGRRLYLQVCDRISRLSALFGLSPQDRRRGRMETNPVDDGQAEFDHWLQKRNRA